MHLSTLDTRSPSHPSRPSAYGGGAGGGGDGQSGEGEGGGCALRVRLALLELPRAFGLLVVLLPTRRPRRQRIPREHALK